MIKEQLQAIANRTTTTKEFVKEAKKVLKVKTFNRQSAYYLCKKYDIKTNFRRGRPERQFD